MRTSASISIAASSSAEESYLLHPLSVKLVSRNNLHVCGVQIRRNRYVRLLESIKFIEVNEFKDFLSEL
jgi:hypothetical protein